jgi:hypothetical protein
MDITIELSHPLSSLTQAKLHQVRRVATVLRSDGFNVTVIAPVEDIELEERLHKQVEP